MSTDDKMGFLCITLPRGEALLLDTKQGIVEIRIKDAEKRPLKSRVYIRGPKDIRIETVLATVPRRTIGVVR